MKAIQLINKLTQQGYTDREIAEEILNETTEIDLRARVGTEHFDDADNYLPPPQVLAHAILDGTSVTELEMALAEFNLYWRDREEGRPVYAHQLFLSHLQRRARNSGN